MLRISNKIAKGEIKINNLKSKEIILSKLILGNKKVIECF